MKPIFIIHLAIFMVFFVNLPAAGAGSHIGMDFTTDSLDDLEYIELEGDTEYFMTHDDEGPYLEARGNNGASGYAFKQKINLKKTPWLSWTWKVDQPLRNNDERTRGGHDFPARVFIVVNTGPFPWQKLVLNYTWGTTSNKGDHWASPYTDKAHDVIIDDASSPTGEWITNQRNVREDFKKYFGRDIRKAHAVAVMTDGDNTGQSPVAGYRRVIFIAEKVDEDPGDQETQDEF
jgi:hypothetical protein